MLLRGGLVADGIGTTTVRADVLIDGQVIAAVGAGSGLPGDCDIVDLAPGSVVCPGFIDAHVHAEGPLLADGRPEWTWYVVNGVIIWRDGQPVTTRFPGQFAS